MCSGFGVRIRAVGVSGLSIVSAPTSASAAGSAAATSSSSAEPWSVAWLASSAVATRL
jgi:hypothetical protein